MENEPFSGFGGEYKTWELEWLCGRLEMLGCTLASLPVMVLEVCDRSWSEKSTWISVVLVMLSIPIISSRLEFSGTTVDDPRLVPFLSSEILQPLIIFLVRERTLVSLVGQPLISFML